MVDFHRFIGYSYIRAQIQRIWIQTFGQNSALLSNLDGIHRMCFIVEGEFNLDLAHQIL